jgi:hypothetical protein
MKIALCIPAYGDTKAKFTQSLANLLIHMHAVKFTDAEGRPIAIEAEVFMVACSMLTQSRHKLVAEAVLWGADYLLWMDADHIFPPDAFARLWARGQAVVGCNYARRCSPTAPTASGFDDDGRKALVYTTREKAEANALEEVAHLGFGLCLIDMRVFDALQVQAEAEGKESFLPLFHFEVEGSTVIGEDVYFFDKLRAAGIRIFVDHGLSWEVGHIHERILTNAHAAVQQGRWEQGVGKARARYADRIAELEG